MKKTTTVEVETRARLVCHRPRLFSVLQLAQQHVLLDYYDNIPFHPFWGKVKNL